MTFARGVNLHKEATLGVNTLAHEVVLEPGPKVHRASGKVLLIGLAGILLLICVLVGLVYGGEVRIKVLREVAGEVVVREIGVEKRRFGGRASGGLSV